MLDSHFRRHLLVVAALHVAIIGAVYVASHWRSEKREQVIWIGGSVGGGEPGETVTEEVEAAPPEVPEIESEPVPELLPEPPPEEPTLIAEPPPPSELPLPQATPMPATPRSSTPKPATPTPKPTPKPAPKPTPKATPKATPRALPSASPKKSSSPAATPKASTTKLAGNTPKPGGAKTPATGATLAKSDGNGPGTGNGKGPGKTGRGSGASENGWYYEMIHDRFHTRWEQPTSIVRSTQNFTTTLKIRITKDGTIAHREIVGPSGNNLMDDSVLTAANKVTQIDPLPAGLGGETLEINIVFKLDQGQ